METRNMRSKCKKRKAVKKAATAKLTAVVPEKVRKKGGDVLTNHPSTNRGRLSLSPIDRPLAASGSPLSQNAPEIFGGVDEEIHTIRLHDTKRQHWKMIENWLDEENSRERVPFSASFPMPPYDDDREIIRVLEYTCNMRPSGEGTEPSLDGQNPATGRNQVAGHETPLGRSRRGGDSIRIKLFMVRRKQYDRDGWTLFGAELEVIGQEYSFRRIKIAITTCYTAVDNGKTPVMIQREIGGTNFWEEHSTVDLDHGKFEFQTSSNARFRFLMKMDIVEKVITHMIFIKQNEFGEDVLIWCFCDNLMETRLEVEKQMALQDVSIVARTPEGFRMFRDDNVRVTLKVPGRDVGNPVQTIPADELWFSQSIVKKEFTVRNLRAGRKVRVKIEKVNAERGKPRLCLNNSFTFYPLGFDRL